MRALLLPLLFCVSAATAVAQELPERLQRIISGHDIPVENLSLLVQAVDADAPTISHFPETPRNPASTIKLLTTWVALAELGPTYSWPTEVYLLGGWDGRQLSGDLGIKGYGDPSLVTEELWKLLRALRRIGLEEIDGDLVIDASFFSGNDGDPGAFDRQPYRSYNVLPDAFLVNYKAVRFQFLEDPQGRGVLITADPLPSNLTIRNEIDLVDGPCRGFQAGVSFDLRDPESGGTAIFSGRFPAACSPYGMTRSVLQHDTYAYGVFDTLWQQLGGRLRGRLRRDVIAEDLEPALTWRSPPLAEIIRSINKFSNNVMTRQLLYTMSAELLGPPGTEAGGIEVISNYLQEQDLDPATLVIDNGAGLSRETRISAQLLADVLLLAARSRHSPEYLASLSLGGLDGTTRNRFRGGGVAGSMHVKTGRLDHVSALAGYVHSASGDSYVVVAMLNSPDVHRGPGEELQEALVRWVHELP
ncbi:MAG: D-alanyl-D-alanine carboxypeptidase/D-alanyl-D-alanine-endopeptidase [Candidatus Rariloculaceae bacterium]